MMRKDENLCGDSSTETKQPSQTLAIGVSRKKDREPLIFQIGHQTFPIGISGLRGSGKKEDLGRGNFEDLRPNHLIKRRA